MHMKEDQTQAGKTSRFGELFKKFFTKLPQEGELIQGTVISIDNGAVRLDINGITTGVVRGEELFSESREFSDLHVGDTIEATVIEEENENGEMELSFRVAGKQIVWKKMEDFQKNGLAISAKIIGANKGGLLTQIDALTGFLPVSQLSPDKYPRVPGGDKNRIFDHLRGMVGQTLDVKVITADQNEEKLIVSEKAVWEDAQKSVFDAYAIGDIIEGEVNALTSFGAFIRFGKGLEGLAHISEIAWQRIDHPKDVLKIGDAVKAQIIDLNKSKIYLSIKRLVDDPWKSVKDKYTVGQIVKGTVHKVEPFGLMIKLDDEIHGLAHISELSDAVLTESQLREEYKEGSTHTFEIVSIEPAEHRLGMKREGVKGKRVQKEAKEKDADQPPAEEISAEASKEEETEEKKEETLA